MTQMEDETVVLDAPPTTVEEMFQTGGMILDRGSHGGQSVWVFSEASGIEQDGSKQNQQIEADSGNSNKNDDAELAREGVAAALKLVEADKTAGSAAFNNGELDVAAEFYNRGLALLLRPPLAGTQLANRLAVTLHCNLAAVKLKEGSWRGAEAECHAALRIQPSCVKALYRAGMASQHMGAYSRAITLLDRARTLDPKNLAIAYALEDCEDLLEEQGDQPQDDNANGQEAKEDEGDVANQKEQGQAKAKAEAEVEEHFAQQCMRLVSAHFAQTGDAAATVWMRHVSNDTSADKSTDEEVAPKHTIGKVVIDGAFKSSETLRSALQFVRSQHTTAHATAAVVTVRKRSMLYPLAWWAGDWPLDLQADGVFVELHSGGVNPRAPRTWFMALADGNQTLLPAIELSEDCGLLVDMPHIFDNSAASC